MSHFAVRRITSAPDGLADLLPLVAEVVAVRHRADGLAFFCASLERPFTPPPGIPLDRPVRHIVVTSGAGGVAPHNGMRNLPVELALVVDDTLLGDAGIDPAKILPVGVVEIDDLPEIDAVETADTLSDDTSRDDTARDDATPVDTRHDEAPAPGGEDTGPIAVPPVDAGERAQLPDTSSQHVAEPPTTPDTADLDTADPDTAVADGAEPGRAELDAASLDTASLDTGALEARLGEVAVILRTLSGVDDAPSYAPGLTADGALFAVSVHDPVDGPLTRQCSHADDALGLLATDLAGAWAWAWARRTPALQILDEQAALRAVWLPYWHVLVHAVSPAWADGVRDVIRRAYADPTLTLTPPRP